MDGRKLIFGCVIALTACDDTTSNPAAKPCADYVIAVGDLQDGVLTDVEFRSEIQDIADAAAGSDAEIVTRDLLRELTSGTTGSAIAAMRVAARHCNDVVDAELNG